MADLIRLAKPLSPGGGASCRLRVVLGRLDPGFPQEESIFMGRCIEACFQPGSSSADLTVVTCQEGLNLLMPQMGRSLLHPFCLSATDPP